MQKSIVRAGREGRVRSILPGQMMPKRDSTQVYTKIK